MEPIQAFTTPFFAFLLGLCIGSFLNVCIFRLKSGGNVVVPPTSFCPRCKHDLAWYDNLPLLSYLLLQGKCRYCRRPISIQYPLVEGVTALLFGTASVMFSDPRSIVASYFLLSFLVLLVVSDIKWRILPHAFNNLFIGAGFVFALVDSWKSRSAFVLLESIEGFLAVGALFLVIGNLFPSGMGGGDVKMAAALGVWFGMAKSLVIVFVAFGAGALLMLPFLAMGKIRRRALIPFGPFLAMPALYFWFRPEDAQNLLDWMA